MHLPQSISTCSNIVPLYYISQGELLCASVSPSNCHYFEFPACNKRLIVSKNEHLLEYIYLIWSLLINYDTTKFRTKINTHCLDFTVHNYT